MKPWMIGWTVFCLTLLVAMMFMVVLVVDVFARDLGQWENTDPEIRQYYKHLMMPDNPAVSCCGESDAYFADSYEIVKDPTTGYSHFFAIITDERDDVPLQRKHIDIGTRIEVPNNKLKFGPDDPQRVEANKNPTGHGIIFVSPGSMTYSVYCYVSPGGV
jgi:hypothetical protein